MDAEPSQGIGRIAAEIDFRIGAGVDSDIPGNATRAAGENQQCGNEGKRVIGACSIPDSCWLLETGDLHSIGSSEYRPGVVKIDFESRGAGARFVLEVVIAVTAEKLPATVAAVRRQRYELLGTAVGTVADVDPECAAPTLAAAVLQAQREQRQGQARQCQCRDDDFNQE